VATSAAIAEGAQDVSEEDPAHGQQEAGGNSGDRMADGHPLAIASTFVPRLRASGDAASHPMVVMGPITETTR
jgi:hypothetical protein